MSTFLPLLLACGGSWADPSREFGAPVPAEAPLHPSTEILPLHVGAVNTELRDVHGAPVGVACATCHSPGESGQALVEGSGSPEAFHSGVELQHGRLGCFHCHDTDRRLLKLADGSKVELQEATLLCSECHGPQARDYAQGLHGGKAGYWDRRRGPVQRNACVLCHAPHSPAYEAVVPTFAPHDRFLPDGD